MMQRCYVAALTLPIVLAGFVPGQEAAVSAAPSAGMSLPADAPAALKLVTKAELMRHATYLASDQLGGRLTGSPGQAAAAQYIAEHFGKLGLEPLGDPADGKVGYLQHYGITKTSLSADSGMKLGSQELVDGFAVLGGKPMAVVKEGKLRFVGLGRVRGSTADLTAEDDLAGAIAVAVVRPPSGQIDRQLTVEQKFGLSFRSFGQLGNTAKALEKKGASAVLFLMLDDPTGLADVLNYLAISPGKHTVAARFPGADSQMAMVSSMLGGDSGAPAAILSVECSRRLLGELGIELDAVRQSLGGDAPMPKGKDDVQGRVALTVTVDAEATASNVVAVLRGSDPELSKEAIVYSAHHDHVGRRMDGEVFNGADDNASGSAGLLAIATAYATAQEKPKRSVIFLSVSGEELGLWGSAYYADNPTWEAERIIANINTDMIGRSGPESDATQVTVTPSNRHAMFSSLVRDAAGFGEQLGLSFESGDKYYMRSDHYNFAKKGIPVVFFCNGEHEDYHQVTDHADKLDGDKMERIARLALWTGMAAANAAAALEKLGKQPNWR
jgi:hypothetical protein